MAIIPMRKAASCGRASPGSTVVTTTSVWLRPGCVTEMMTVGTTQMRRIVVSELCLKPSVSNSDVEDNGRDRIRHLNSKGLVSR